MTIIPTLDPDVIIIGGSIGAFFDKFAPRLSKIIDDQLPKYLERPRLLQAKHPDEAVIYGCYYYALDKLNI